MTDPTDEQVREIARKACLLTKRYSPAFYCTVWCQVHHGPGPDCQSMMEVHGRRVAAVLREGATDD